MRQTYRSPAVVAMLQRNKVGGLDRRPAVIAGDRLDRRPAHEVASLAGDVAAVDLHVGLAVRGRDAGPGRGGAPRGSGFVADLGDEDRRHDRAHPVDGLDRRVGLVTLQPARQVGLDEDELALVDLERSRSDSILMR